jgi:hypothetical protein
MERGKDSARIPIASSMLTCFFCVLRL